MPTFPGLSGGVIGVDVFFVLSGYLISSLLIRERAINDRIALSAFYARRLRRLLPAMLCMIGISALAASLLLPPTESAAKLASLPYALSWTSNLFFAFRHVDYFDELSNSGIFLHAWSLGVEEQFYLLWPLLILLLPAKWVLDQMHAAKLLLVFAALTLASLALAAVWAAVAPLQAYFLAPVRIWQFALGALLFAAQAQCTPHQATHGRSMQLGRLAIVLATALLLSPERTHYGLNALGASLGCALFIAGGHRLATTSLRPLLTNTSLVWIGDRSYSLYLWHWHCGLHSP